MGLFHRLNSLVLARIRERAGEAAIQGVGVSGRSLLLDLSTGARETLDLQRLSHVAAIKIDVHAGTEIALLLEFAEPPRLVQVPESCAGWEALCAALDAVPGSTPLGVWYARLLAQDDEASIDIWPATPA